MSSTGWAACLSLLAMTWLIACSSISFPSQPDRRTNLQRAKVFLAAGDFRQAVEACQQEVKESPSAESYLYLTYVYQALDAYVEALAKKDQWVTMQHLYLNLTGGEPESLTEPSNILVRIEKELIQSAARQQADVTAELATRLDKSVVMRVWPQQTKWRKMNSEGWWLTVPPEWSW